MAVDRRAVAAVVAVALGLYGCGASDGATGIEAAAPLALPGCTRDAEVSVFRPRGLDQLAIASSLVVSGRVVAAEVVDVAHPVAAPSPPPSAQAQGRVLGTAGGFVATWVRSTVEIDSVVFAGSGVDGRVTSVLLQTLAAGATCDRLDQPPRIGVRYVLFLAPHVEERLGSGYFTVGGSATGRYVLDGDRLRPDPPAGGPAFAVAHAVASIPLPSLGAALRTARQDAQTHAAETSR